MQLFIVLLASSLLSVLSFKLNSLAKMGVTKVNLRSSTVKAVPLSPEVAESRVTKFDRLVYEACSRIPKGGT